MEQVYYCIEFDSQEAYGKFSDSMFGSEWWDGFHSIYWR